jgi:hypothetical protein
MTQSPPLLAFSNNIFVTIEKKVKKIFRLWKKEINI